MVEAGRHFWRSSGPISLLHQGHLEPVAQDHVQTAFEYLQGWRLHNLSGQPVPQPRHPHSEKVFPDVQTEPSAFQLLPIASGPVPRHDQDEPGSVLFAPSFQVFIYIKNIPPEPSLLQAEQSQLPQPFLICEMSLNHPCGSLLDSL